MQVYINGKATTCQANTSLLTLLKENNIETNGVAVAINQKVIPKAIWEETIMEAESKILVIKATQGG